MLLLGMHSQLRTHTHIIIYIYSTLYIACGQKTYLCTNLKHNITITHEIVQARACHTPRDLITEK